MPFITIRYHEVADMVSSIPAHRRHHVGVGQKLKPRECVAISPYNILLQHELMGTNTHARPWRGPESARRYPRLPADSSTQKSQDDRCTETVVGRPVASINPTSRAGLAGRASSPDRRAGGVR